MVNWELRDRVERFQAAMGRVVRGVTALAQRDVRIPQSEPIELAGPPTPRSVQVVLREGPPPSRLREVWQPHPDATGADPAHPPRRNPSNPR
jgi:hypothetical protein